jgi:glutathione S-transferase
MKLHDYELDIGTARAGVHRLFRTLGEHLWFAEQLGNDCVAAGDHPTIVDIGCFLHDTRHLNWSTALTHEKEMK